MNVIHQQVQVENVEGMPSVVIRQVDFHALASLGLQETRLLTVMTLTNVSIEPHAAEKHNAEIYPERFNVHAQMDCLLIA